MCGDLNRAEFNRGRIMQGSNLKGKGKCIFGKFRGLTILYVHSLNKIFHI